jgi:hypothetical protein
MKSCVVDNANASGNSDAPGKQSWFALLNKYERANNSRFPFTNHAGARAECLALMRGQSANADCHRAPARHLGFANVILGVPFATPRARWTVSGV